MAAGRKSDFTLPTLDDLFSSQAEREEESTAKIRAHSADRYRRISQIIRSKIREDEDMVQHIDSIKERGVITTFRWYAEDDGRYEIISGHNESELVSLPSLNTAREVCRSDKGRSNDPHGRKQLPNSHDTSL
jgi:ParB family chromosome partitioning protein